MIPVLLTVLSLAAPGQSYPAGPPLDACLTMFPRLHNVSAQTSNPPFEITVDNNNYTAGGQVTVTISATDPTNIDMEGVFIQARIASDCTNKVAVGTYEPFPPTEMFLKRYDCNNNVNSAVAHKMNIHTTTKTFTWNAPNPAVGHIYFRGTFVRETLTFWTAVASEYVRDSSSTAALPTTACGAEIGIAPAVKMSVLSTICALIFVILLQ